MAHWIALGATVFLTVLANVLLKHSGSGADPIPATQAEISLVRAALSPMKVGALSVYATAFLVYGYALKSIAVSVAYPIVASVSLVTLALVGAIMFDESFPLSKVVGTVLVAIGVVLIARV